MISKLGLLLRVGGRVSCKTWIGLLRVLISFFLVTLKKHFFAMISKLGLLVRVGGRVSCKSRVGSHVVTSGFLGKHTSGRP